MLFQSPPSAIYLKLVGATPRAANALAAREYKKAPYSGVMSSTLTVDRPCSPAEFVGLARLFRDRIEAADADTSRRIDAIPMPLHRAGIATRRYGGLHSADANCVQAGRW